MGYPDVRAGESFRPSASLENKVRHFFNGLDGFRVSAAIPPHVSTRLTVYNSTANTIASGSAVNFPESTDFGELEDNIIPCAPVTDVSKAWGIVQSDLGSNDVGSCIVTGPVKVKISGSDGDYVLPDISTPGVFLASSNGGVPIVFRHGAEAIINLGGGSGGATAHQFKVIDSSTTDAEGNITQHKVSVVNGHDSALTSAGVINGIAYNRTDLTLSASGTYYVYAIGGAIYALNNTYASDLFPAVLLATVEVVDGRLEITQESFADNIVVPIVARTVGSTTLEYEISIADYVLSVTYYVVAKANLNSTTVSMEKSAIPISEDGSLYAYIEKTVVEPDEVPVGGFTFEYDGTFSFNRKVLGYRLSDTEFRITERTTDTYFFTFTRIYLNATEAGE